MIWISIKPQSDQVAPVEDQRSAQDQGFRFSVENDFLDEDQDAVHLENIEEPAFEPNAAYEDKSIIEQQRVELEHP